MITDFHGSFDNYLETKASFFQTLGTRSDSNKDITKIKTAIVNIDDPNSGFVLSKTDARILTYGVSNTSADITAKDLRLHEGATSFVACTPWGSFPVSLNLRGLFNVYNALAAIGCGLTAGLDRDTIGYGLKRLKGVPGRFESLDEGQPFAVIVDFAHTPDSLENVLRVARYLGSGNLTVVFGCGEIETDQRPMMGKVAATLADRVIVTTDNPRTENPDSICKESEEGILNAEQPRLGYEIILNRAHAIQKPSLWHKKMIFLSSRVKVMKHIRYSVTKLSVLMIEKSQRVC